MIRLKDSSGEQHMAPAATRVSITLCLGFFACLSFGDEGKASRTVVLEQNQLPRNMAYSPNGQLLAVASGEDDGPGEIKLYSAASGRLLATLKGHAKPINGLSFSPDSRLLFSGG